MRRALHNQIQELRGNVRVFCRVRPSTSTLQCAELGQDGSSVTVLRDPEDPATAAAFDFDRAFGPKSSQGEIFEEVSQLVQSALDGYKAGAYTFRLFPST